MYNVFTWELSSKVLFQVKSRDIYSYYDNLPEFDRSDIIAFCKLPSNLVIPYVVSLHSISLYNL